ncbi:metalloprotease mep1 [Colletotrichum truncatum]|uniref:Metalloprotease mep1 n=1 Tax=Colletotrichum truncatum TaxID=5467 RepID=A0ACC3ZGX5_COLTU|nr:metalloprotease mep1 [Colletotrichum truncatum]KAF6790558.1 metalloprotease mep1 [Colletotrichum truncatum]
MSSRATTALVLSLGASLALGNLQCVNDDSLAAAELPNISLPAYVKRQDAPKSVDVYFHITSTEANKDRITDAVVDAQFEVLHSTYLRHGFELNLVNVSRIVDNIAGKGFYAEDGPGIPDFDGYLAWRTQTRRGAYDALNVYFFSDLNPAVGGACNLAGVVQDGSQQFYLDGCFVNGDTMPGLYPRTGNDTVPRKGHIAVHEVGHWFGLFHTFHGRFCDGINDQVADTPAQAGASSGCPIGRNSCPDSPGLDPIHNFMDYSDDTCTTEFTPGQEARMHQQFDVYRRWQG